MKNTNTAVVEKPITALATGKPPVTTAIMSKEEELISVARLIQAMSKQESCSNPNGPDFIKGDMVVYPQRTKVSDYKNPFSVIFLRNTLEWANFEVVGQKEEWRSEEPRVDKIQEEGGNEHWELDYLLDGKKMRRYRQITMYVLLPTQVEAFLKDALSESPSLSGSISPVAIKSRNYSRKAMQEILNVIASKEFNMRNALRANNNLPAIPVWAYEHILQPIDKTNAKGTFQILAYKGSTGIKNPEVRTIAEKAHSIIAARSDLKTVVMDEEQGSSSRGTMSDDV